jgi:hypothetical protein
LATASGPRAPLGQCHDAHHARGGDRAGTIRTAVGDAETAPDVGPWTTAVRRVSSLMRPEVIGLTILTIAVVAVGLLMLADRAGWRSPLPTLHLSQRWVWTIYLLMALVTALQALRLAGTL